MPKTKDNVEDGKGIHWSMLVDPITSMIQRRAVAFFLPIVFAKGDLLAPPCQEIEPRGSTCRLRGWMILDVNDFEAFCYVLNGSQWMVSLHIH